MTDNKFESLLQNVIEKTNGTQMEEEEYRYISNFLGNKNFLVFGCGYDTPLWKHVNKNGLTIFLESNPEWINPDDNAYLINYTTTLGKSKSLLAEYKNNNFNNLKLTLPDIVKETNWDCIFVDAPPGGSKKHPGRMQSIFTAKELSSPSTEIFIHDCDREAERIWSSTLFTHLQKTLVKLKHYRL